MTLPLTLLWLVLGLARIAPDVDVRELEGLQVHVASEAPNGWILGLTCHSDFERVEGHTQRLCTVGGERVADGTIVLFPGALERSERARNVLVHETYHLRNRDALHESEARAYACARAPAGELCPQRALAVEAR